MTTKVESRQDYHTRLITLRDKLAEAVDDAEPNMFPQVVGQYRSVLADIATLELAMATAEGTGPTNEVGQRAAARKDRQSKAKAKRTA